MPKINKIAIVGAGLVGSMMAIYLARRGYSIALYERRDDLRQAGAEAGRSINLALSNRGLLALDELGLSAAVQKLVIPMYGRMMHDNNERLTFQPYGKQGQAIQSISRSDLNALLMNEAERLGVRVNFRHKCSEVDINNTILSFETDRGPTTYQPDIIIGADGAFSLVRGFMQRQDRFNFSQHYIAHGYKELTIPAATGNNIEKHALHIWPRGNFMLIALPNLEGSFTCTLFFPFEGEPSFNTIPTGKEAAGFFKNNFPDAFNLMPHLTDEFDQNPTSSLVTIKCHPWVSNKTLLMGDASHAIVPFYGQGMNSGFEDCRILNQLLDQSADNWEATFNKFNDQRKPDADAIADLAFQNFTEMRDLVADDMFLLRKKIEAKLHELYPDKWIPLYSMVTFNEHIPYSEALRMGRRQEAIMDEVMKIPGIEGIWQDMDFEGIVGRD